MNTVIRVCLSFYVLFVGLTVTNIVYGKGGIVQLKELGKYKTELESNISDLGKSRAKLERNLYSVQTSGDYLVLSAREIGYFEKNQGVIRFGYPLGNIEDNNYGHIIPVKNYSKIDRRQQHLFVLLAALVTYLLTTLFFRKRKNNDH
jgi:cell division protein FtsB